MAAHQYFQIIIITILILGNMQFLGDCRRNCLNSEQTDLIIEGQPINQKDHSDIRKLTRVSDKKLSSIETLKSKFRKNSSSESVRKSLKKQSIDQRNHNRSRQNTSHKDSNSLINRIQEAYHNTAKLSGTKDIQAYRKTREFQEASQTYGIIDFSSQNSKLSKVKSNIEIKFHYKSPQDRKQKNDYFTNQHNTILTPQPTEFSADKNQHENTKATTNRSYLQAKQYGSHSKKNPRNSSHRLKYSSQSSTPFPSNQPNNIHLDELSCINAESLGDESLGDSSSDYSVLVNDSLINKLKGYSGNQGFRFSAHNHHNYQ